MIQNYMESQPGFSSLSDKEFAMACQDDCQTNAKLTM